MGKLINRAKMTVSGTPGTGTITLGSASTGYRTFAAAGVADGDLVSYVIEDGTAWEYGLGTYTASGTTLARTTVLGSSNANAAITATSGAVVYGAPNSGDIGAWVPLGTFNPASVATLDINSLLTSAYDDYLIVLENVVPATTGVYFQLRVSTNGGSSFATTGYADAVGGSGFIGVAEPGVGPMTVVNTSSLGISGMIWLYNVNSTTRQRLINGILSNGSASAGLCFMSGAYTTTGTAINAIRAFFSSGNIASGNFKVYGLRKA